MSDTYRQCAAIAVLRENANGEKEVLLLHKPRKNDAWQLPQGGIEQGESIEQAASRELMEEAGLEVDIVGSVSQVYQYDFPAAFRAVRPDHICGQCVSFVVALEKEGSAVQVDNEEIDDFCWVKPECLQKFLRRKQYLEKVYDVLAEAKKVYGV